MNSNHSIICNYRQDFTSYGETLVTKINTGTVNLKDQKPKQTIFKSKIKLLCHMDSNQAKSSYKASYRLVKWTFKKIHEHVSK